MQFTGTLCENSVSHIWLERDRRRHERIRRTMLPHFTMRFILVFAVGWIGELHFLDDTVEPPSHRASDVPAIAVEQIATLAHGDPSRLDTHSGRDNKLDIHHVGILLALL